MVIDIEQMAIYFVQLSYLNGYHRVDALKRPRAACVHIH